MSMATLTHRIPSGPLSAIARIDAEGFRRQPLLWAAGLVMLAMMVPTYAALLLDDRVVNDVNVWLKPLKFEGSIALFLGTLAWFWAYLPERSRKGRLLNGFAVISVALLYFEIAYIVLQSARGVGSHFNTTTPLEGLMFSLMGAAALIFTAFPAALGVAIARSPGQGLAPAFRLSVVLGLVLTFVLGAGAGIAIGVNGGHWVDAPPTDLGGLPVFGWTRQGGDLRVGHFLGIHAMQILPLLGLAVARTPRGMAIVWAGTAAFVVLTVATLVQALAGQPFLGFIG